MFSRKKPEPTERRNHDLSQFGLTDIPDDFDAGAGDLDGDSDLEAELAAVATGGGEQPKPKPKPKLMAASDLDRMIADSLRDVGSDEELSGDDEKDPGLLQELRDITGGEVRLENNTTESTEVPDETADEKEPPQLFLPTTTIDAINIIKQRIEMYKQAELNAKAAGEECKGRRFNRGLKTLNDLLKQASAGKQINVGDIPPEVSVKPAVQPETDDSEGDLHADPPKVISRATLPTEETPTTSPTPQTEQSPTAQSPKNPILVQLQNRQSEYITAALNCQRSGETANASQFLKVVKQFDMVIKMYEDGQEVDLSDMPPPPEQFLEFLANMQAAADVAPTTISSEINVPS